MFISLLVLCVLGNIYCLEEEPRCLSKFDWQDKLLEKTIRTELEMQEYLRKMDKAMDSIRVHKNEFDSMKNSMDETVENLKAFVETKIQEALSNVRMSMEELQTTKSDIQETVQDLLERIGMEMKQLKEDVAKSIADKTSPTIVFSANNLADRSPAVNQIMVFRNVIQNIGNAYDTTTGIFTVPLNGTFMFSTQVCADSGDWGQFQLSVDRSDNLILAIRVFGKSGDESSSGSVAVYLTEGQKVWVQSSHGDGYGLTLNSYNSYCWNHFSGALIHA